MEDERMDRFSELLHVEINTTLKKGSLYAAVLGVGCGIIILTLEFSGLVHDFTVPGIWAFFVAYTPFSHTIWRGSG